MGRSRISFGIEEHGRIRAPQKTVADFHIDLLYHIHDGSGSDGGTFYDGVIPSFSDTDVRHYGQRGILRKLVPQGGPYPEQGSPGAVAVWHDPFGLHIDTPGRKVHLRRAYEPYFPVDTRSGIPSAILLSAVVHMHSQGVVAFLQPLRDIDAEGRVTVRPATGLFPVDINLRSLVHPIEKDGGSRFQTVGRETERLSVPPAAGRIISAVVAGRFVRFGSSFDAPVVGQVECTPRSVVKILFTGLGTLPPIEFPVPVQRDFPCGFVTVVRGCREIPRSSCCARCSP